MALQNSFDLAKKQSEGHSLEKGYVMKDGRPPYNAYYTNQEWGDFLEEMRHSYPVAYKNFSEGDGGELKENKYPPKMASFGSSSRLIYTLSRDIPGFVFEKKLGINVPARNDNQEAQASLDGYLEHKNIFVEAKCREIYSESHPEFNEKYKELYSYLSENTGSLFDYTLRVSKDKNGLIKRHVYFSWEGNSISHLDLKQLLCHMLGIGKKSLIDRDEKHPTLLYLVYRPTEKLLSFVSNRTANSIIRCREIEKMEVDLIDIRSLYRLIVLFLHNKKGVGGKMPSDVVERIANDFSFQFCDQDEYLKLLQ